MAKKTLESCCPGEGEEGGCLFLDIAVKLPGSTQDLFDSLVWGSQRCSHVEFSSVPRPWKPSSFALFYVEGG